MYRIWKENTSKKGSPGRMIFAYPGSSNIKKMRAGVKDRTFVAMYRRKK